MKKFIPLLTAFVITLLIIACKKDKTTEPKGPDDSHSSWKGIGKSTEQPQGTPFYLPEGIKLAGDSIKGYDRNECACNSNDAPCRKGSGELVRVCMGFTNTTGQPITFVLPHGLIIISTSHETQNGLLIQLETIRIEAGSTAFFSIGTYCLNAGRDVASPGDIFKLGPATTNENIQELIELVKNKDIRTVEASAIVQAALWNITDGKGLTTVDRQLINAFPDKQ